MVKETRVAQWIKVPSRNLKVASSSPAVSNVLCPWARHFTSIVSLYPGVKWGATWYMNPLVAPTL